MEDERFLDFMGWLRRYRNLPFPSATNWVEWVCLGNSVLSSGKGDVAEFGCWHGCSAVVLSKACELANKRLFVFDSFEGFPSDLATYSFGNKDCRRYYRNHSYQAPFSEVKHNMEQFGCPAVVVWVKGFFSKTLPEQQDPKQLSTVFIDVDLPLSQQEAYQWVKPRVGFGGIIFIHEWRTAHKYQVFGPDSDKIQSISNSLGYIVSGT